jgi:tetratricopeptide (TPR) repeat protein
MRHQRWPWLLAPLFAFLTTASVYSADEPPRADLAAAVQTLQGRNYAAAEKQFDEILAKQPQSVPALIGRGSCLLYRMAFDQALADFTTATKLVPNNVAAQVGFGSANAELQNWAAARNAYDEALKLDPKSADAFVGRGGVHLAQGNTDLALADFDQALKVQPQSADAFVGRGAVRLRRQDPVMAIADYNEALRLEPENVAALQGRGYAYFLRKDYSHASSDFSEAVRCQPENAEALNRLAWLLAVCPEATRRDGKKAIDLARHACTLSKNESPFFLDTLAAAFAETGDFAEAAKTQARVLELANKMDAGSLDQAKRRQALYAERKAYREP